MIKYHQTFPRTILFPESIPWWTGFSFHDFYFFYDNRLSAPLFSTIEAGYTKLIHLTSINSADWNTICPSRTIKKIKHASREGIKTHPYNEIDTFIEMYNQFADAHHLDRLTATMIKKLPKQNICFFAAFYRDEPIPLVISCFLYDHHTARELYQVRPAQQTVPKNMVAEANLLLHLNVILHFKQAGLQYYDVGGYVPNTTCEKMQGINRFKDSFHATLTPVYRVRSYMLCAIEFIYDLAIQLNIFHRRHKQSISLSHPI